jgi:hypothetical protein
MDRRQASEFLRNLSSRVKGEGSVPSRTIVFVLEKRPGGYERLILASNNSRRGVDLSLTFLDDY